MNHISDLTQPGAALQLAPEYVSVYNSIVRPHLRWTVTRYFAERWVPTLGLYRNKLDRKPLPSAGKAAGRTGWFVVQCRQVIIWNDHSATNGTYSFKRSLDFLTRESGLSRAMIMEILEEPLCSWFVHRKSEKARFDFTRGRPVQPLNTYSVRMDDPLVPVDAEHLVEALQGASATGDDPLERALQRIQWALDQPFDSLRAPDVRHPLRHPDWFKQGPLEVIDLIQRIEPGLRDTDREDPRWTELAIACDSLMDHVINPKDVVGEYYYFRKQWVKQVGRGQAWAIVLLRDRCYDPPPDTNGQNRRRDTWWLPSYDWLAQRIGVDVEAIADWLVGGMNGFVSVLEQQKGRDKSQPQIVSYRLWVALRDPLTLQDQTLYQERLQEHIKSIPQATSEPNPLSQVVSGENELTGRGVIRESELSPGSVIGESELTDDGVTGKSELSHSDVVGETGLTGSDVIGESELSPAGVSGETEQETGGSPGKPNCLKSLVKASVRDENSRGHQTALSTRTDVSAIIAEAITHQHQNGAGDHLALSLLKELVIRDPYRSKIVQAHVPVEIIWGWALYAEHNKGQEVKKFGGFMVTILMNPEDRDKVPSPFDRLASLHPDQWTTFALHAREEAEGFASSVSFTNDPATRELFSLWKEIYGDKDFRQLPFDMGREASLRWEAERKVRTDGTTQASVGTRRGRAGQWKPDYG